jgi:hypothetical protein
MRGCLPLEEYRVSHIEMSGEDEADGRIGENEENSHL